MRKFALKSAVALAAAFIFGACDREDKDQPEPEAVPRLQELRSLYVQKLAEAETMRDPETGWLARNDCDAMIWSGKYAASREVIGVNILAAEYPDAPGKFGRRPPPWCWTAKEGDVGSKTEWSRDMAVAGLFPYAFMTDQRAILERHAAYGKAHNWFLGDPVADGRTFYTPEMQGLLLKTIEALGGAKAPDKLWPSIWTSGLKDYQAHLQVMSIWLHGEAAQLLQAEDQIPRRGSADGAAALRISETMYDRLQEHAEREPNNPLYLAVRGLYDGDLNPAVRVLLDPLMPLGSYVRCADIEQCRIAEWLFAASIVLDKMQLQE